MGRPRVGQPGFARFRALPAAELVPEVPMGLAHFASEILPGLAQLTLQILSGTAEFFPRFPSGAPEVFVGSPDFGPVPERMVVVAASRHGENN